MTVPPSLSNDTSTHLDYTDWDPSSPTSPSSLRFLSSLRHSLLDYGFFYLFSCPLSSSSLSSRMTSLVERFFSLPLQTRMAIDMSNSAHFRGYTKFLGETTRGKSDLRDQVDFATHFPHPLEPHKGRQWRNLVGPNQYLADEVCQGFRSTVEEWFEEAQKVNSTLTEAIERALGTQRGRLMRYLEPKEQGAAFARVKLIRYPPGNVVDGVKRGEGNQGVGAHKDSGWLTLLATSPIDGLQVQSPSGTWFSVPHLPSSIIVNFGQQFEYLSHSLLQSATHRVLSNPSASQARYSVAFFSCPALDARLEPLDIDTEVSEEFRALAQEKRGVERVSEVPKGDLFVRDGEEFGDVAWRGFVRSHRSVVERWYPHLLNEE